MSNSASLHTYNHVVIVSHNSEQYIDTLLDELTKEESVHRIIIIDNASTDRTREIVSNYKSSKIKSILRNKNWGFAKSVNFAINKYVRGGQIILINPDSRDVRPGVRKLFDNLANPNIDICGGMVLDFENNNIQQTVYKIPNANICIFELSSLTKILNKFIRIKSSFLLNFNETTNMKQVEGVSGCFFGVKYDVWSILNGFDENFFMYLEDVDLCKRARLNGFSIWYLPEATIRHVSGGSSTNKHRINYTAWSGSRKYYTRKWHPIAYIVAYIIYTIEDMITSIKRKI